MSLRKVAIAGLLAVGGLGFSADRASAQVAFGPAGVTIGGSNSQGIVVPYSGLKGTTIVGPNGAYTPSTGTTYAPAYNSPYGGTSYYSPQTGNFYNPNYGTYSSQTTSVNSSYPGAVYSTPGVYGNRYATPVYGSYPVTTTPVYGSYPVTSFGGVPVGGYRIR